MDRSSLCFPVFIQAMVNMIVATAKMQVSYVHNDNHKDCIENNNDDGDDDDEFSNMKN